MNAPPTITRVRLRGYKSIASCDVRLGRLTFLIGANGSGKSNFFDALGFLGACLDRSLGHALDDRGGIGEICHRPAGSTAMTTEFGIAIEVALSGGDVGTFAILVGGLEDGRFMVLREDCALRTAAGEDIAGYRVERGEIVASNLDIAPAAADDRLYLVHASGLEVLRPLYDTLSRLVIYNFEPRAISELQPLNGSSRLARDGHNLAAVYQRLMSHAPAAGRRVAEYLGKILPNLEGLGVRRFGSKATIEFRQSAKGGGRSFLAANMSDGTLRALGILVALHQSTVGDGAPVAIEEPELALHPAATGVLLDSLEEAASHVQVLVTSHSPELLDSEHVDPASILPVTLDDGETVVGVLDEFGRRAMGDRLATAGELLRLNQVTAERPVPGSTAVGLFDVG